MTTIIAIITAISSLLFGTTSQPASSVQSNQTSTSIVMGNVDI
jgi:hypothetical protein